MASLRFEIVLLAVLLVILGVAHSMTLEGRSDASGRTAVEGSAMAKRGGRRITRGRYRMGYMFGKRSGLEGQVATLLSRKAMSVKDLTSALQTDAALANRVARFMDKNGDGYVAVTELL